MRSRYTVSQSTVHLDMLILRVLARESLHGCGIADSSLNPALQRLMLNGYVEGEWAASDNNRRARYYTLPAAGKKYQVAERANFERYVGAIHRVLQDSMTDLQATQSQRLREF